MTQEPAEEPGESAAEEAAEEASEHSAFFGVIGARPPAAAHRPHRPSGTSAQGKNIAGSGDAPKADIHKGANKGKKKS